MANFCAEILDVGKNFFAGSTVKKMSRFEEVGKNFEWQFPVIGLLENLLKQLFFYDLPDMS